MARYKLLSPHFIDGQYLEAGTEVGDGTPFSITKPSIEMEGVDDAGKKAVEERAMTYGSLEKALPIKLKDSK